MQVKTTMMYTHVHECPKSERQTLPSVNEDAEKLNSHSPLVVI